MPRRRTHDDCPETHLPCWVDNCSQRGPGRITRAVRVRVATEVTGYLVLCPLHIEALGLCEREAWPAAVAEDAVAA